MIKFIQDYIFSFLLKATKSILKLSGKQNTIIMRTLSFILIFGFLISCKKDNNVDLSRRLTGKWELAKISNMIGISNYPPGNNITIEFKANLKYTSVDSTGLPENGSYTASFKKDCSGDKKRTYVTFSSDLANNFYEIEDNNLIFSTSNCVSDGGVVTYRKIQ